MERPPAPGTRPARVAAAGRPLGYSPRMNAPRGRGLDHPYFARPRPWLVAHRGGSGVAPENTLAAFDRAVELGADAIETDVRLSRDGEVVIFHDDDTRRITGVRGTIEDRRLSEIRTLDAGATFTADDGPRHPWRGVGVRIPTLAEAFERYPGMRFNIEAKTADPALAEALVRTIRSARREQLCCVGSAIDRQGERIRSLLPEAAQFLPEGAARSHVLAAWGWTSDGRCPEGYDLAALPIRFALAVPVVTPAVVAHFRGRGMAIQVWTVDEERDMRRLVRLGVDGIMTDRPDRLRRVLGR